MRNDPKKGGDPVVISCSLLYFDSSEPGFSSSLTDLADVIWTTQPQAPFHTQQAHWFSIRLCLYRLWWGVRVTFCFRSSVHAHFRKAECAKPCSTLSGARDYSTERVTVCIGHQNELFRLNCGVFSATNQSFVVVHPRKMVGHHDSETGEIARNKQSTKGEGGGRQGKSMCSVFGSQRYRKREFVDPLFNSREHRSLVTWSH